MRQVAARLIAYEAAGNKSCDPERPPAFYVCEKLRPHLAMLMGKAGFRAVLSRALVVAGAEVRWLAALEVNAEGALSGWDKTEARVTPKELTEGGVHLVAQLLGLLAAFIGDGLTLLLVLDLWPKLSAEDFKFTQGYPS